MISVKVNFQSLTEDWQRRCRQNVCRQTGTYRYSDTHYSDTRYSNNGVWVKGTYLGQGLG